MTFSLIKRTPCAVAALLCLTAAAPQARAFELQNHIANADTYVETYMPRVSEDGGSGTGFFVERHYNFGLKRLTERYFGEGSMRVDITPFSDYDRADGSNYIEDTIRIKACGAASVQNAETFLVNVCSGKED